MNLITGGIKRSYCGEILTGAAAAVEEEWLSSSIILFRYECMYSSDWCLEVKNRFGYNFYKVAWVLGVLLCGWVGKREEVEMM